MSSNVVRLQRSPGAPLSNATLPLHSKLVAVPEYDRASLERSIVHIGLGNFHRAHQAVYFDDLAARGISRDWGITGVSLRHRRMKACLSAQDGLYTVVQRSHGQDSARIVGSICQSYYAGEDRSAVLAALTDEQTRIVTLTITGDGYCVDDRTGQFDRSRGDALGELHTLNHFSSAWAYLAEALYERRRAGVAPFTVMSCDNVQENGQAARSALLSFTELRDPSLSRWIDRNVAFPCTMVDRITPKTGPAERDFVESVFGVADRSPVLAEPFRQWIIEDQFCHGRPPLEEVGVEFVSDVGPHKLVKTRVLNGSHCAIAYLAILAGHKQVDQALRDPILGGYVRQLIRDEIAPLLPAVPGLDLDDYRATVIDRFGNPRITDQLSRLAARGSTKMPTYLLPSLHEAIAAGRPHTLLTLAVAGWFRYLRGTDLTGRPIEIDDPQSDLLKTLATTGQNNPEPLLRHHDIFSTLPSAPGFVNRLRQTIDEIDTHGVATTLRRHLTASRKELVGK
jgi:mannitol 2-dehydrogenase